MKILSYLITLGIGIYLGAMLQQCTHTCRECPTMVKSDTTRSITKVYPDTNKVTTMVLKPVPVRSSQQRLAESCSHGHPRATMDNNQPLTTTMVGREINIYQDSLVDSNVSIVVRDSVAGEILRKSISYRLKVPQIRETITITNNYVDTVSVPAGGLYLGAEFGTNFNGKSMVAPEIEYLTKKGYAYSYSYDLLNNVHSVGIKRRIK